MRKLLSDRSIDFIVAMRMRGRSVRKRTMFFPPSNPEKLQETVKRNGKNRLGLRGKHTRNL